MNLEPSQVTMVADGSSGHQDLEERMARMLGSAFKVWKERQRKYGTGNIARRGPSGIMVRLDDKMARLDRVVSGLANPDTSDETLLDTCIDITNYVLMLHIVQGGNWPGWPHN